MIVGRCVAGIALGILNPTIPIYISELARPQERARLVGIFGLLVAIGFCLANWIGYACSYANGDVTWRLALAMQCPLALLLMGLSVILPESPRWRKSPRSPVLYRDIREYYSETMHNFGHRKDHSDWRDAPKL